MARLGLPVPPGFTISTRCVKFFYKNNKKLNTKIKFEIKKELKKLSQRLRKSLVIIIILY